MKKTEVTQEGSKATFVLNQDVIAPMTDELRETVKHHLALSVSEAVFDLQHVKFVDSVGIGVFISTFNTLRKTNGKVRIINVSKSVLDLFTTLRLVQYLNVEGAQ